MSDPARPRALGSSLARNPDLDIWIRIEPDGTIALRTGKAELGQGIRSAIARIGADELDVSLDRIRVETADSAAGPNELYTVGSMSLEESGNALRQAAAEARQFLLQRAAERLGAPISELEIDDGTIVARGTSRLTDYWQLMGGRRFERRVTGEVRPKDPAHHRWVGRSGPRIDLLSKLRGGAFLHDMALEGMLHARVVHALHAGAQLEAIDLETCRAMPGVVEVIRDGSFVGVVAEREEQAIRAREQLLASARWSKPRGAQSSSDVHADLRARARLSFQVIDGAAVEGPIPAHRPPERARHTLVARYTRPFQMHASIGPSVALAVFEQGQLHVWSHSQGVTVLRFALAEALRMSPDQVRVTHAEGAGCYGHNGADDAALDAALLARAVPGRPIRLQWMRDDEHRLEPYAPACQVDLTASLDAEGRVIDWSHEVLGYTHMGRGLPYGKRSGLRAAWELADPLPPPTPRPRLEPHAGIHRNADPLYVFPNKRVIKHFVADSPLRVSSMRGLGAFGNVFAIESFMDELAEAAAMDPLEFRLRHLRDSRARAVLEAAAARASWRRQRSAGHGQGLAVARYKNSKAYAAIVVDVHVAPDGRLRLERAVIAADAGQIVEPDTLCQQLEGGFIQAASWTLHERVVFDDTGVRNKDWDAYPILRFDEVPELQTVLIDRPDQPFLGAGEATTGPTPAAIANAISHATGVRPRDVPFLRSHSFVLASGFR